MEILYETSAGIDVHRDSVVVSIRQHDALGRERVETRTFETFHDSLLEMNGWLDANEVPIVPLQARSAPPRRSFSSRCSPDWT